MGMLQPTSTYEGHAARMGKTHDARHLYRRRAAVVLQVRTHWHTHAWREWHERAHVYACVHISSVL
eukprot:1952176-Alexandrium_andersonii.AAC.1